MKGVFYTFREILNESFMVLYIRDIENNPTCPTEKDGDPLRHEGLNSFSLEWFIYSNAYISNPFGDKILG